MAEAPKVESRTSVVGLVAVVVTQFVAALEDSCACDAEEWGGVFLDSRSPIPGKLVATAIAESFGMSDCAEGIDTNNNSLVLLLEPGRLLVATGAVVR